MKLLSSIWNFFGLYQTKRVRLVHLLILILVITQIVISNWMNVSPKGIISHQGVDFYFTWLHISIGIALLFLAIVLIVSCFKERGLRHFYPYLWGDFSQIRQDVTQLSKFKLPESSPRGLATSVQGLGLGAILIVIGSGLTWFFLWLQGAAVANEALQLHKTLTGLIEVYIFGHGFMGLVHFILWYRNKS